MLAARGDGTVSSSLLILAASHRMRLDRNIPVRRAVPNDAASIASVHIRTWQIAYRGQLPEAFLDQLSDELARRTEFWRTHITAPPENTEIWVAPNEERVNAFVALGPARGAAPKVSGEVYAIYVDPHDWNRGFGRTLFTHATARLTALGFSSAMLWVLASNARARRFYQLAGWTADGSTKTEALPGGIELREVCYRITLRP